MLKHNRRDMIVSSLQFTRCLESRPRRVLLAIWAVAVWAASGFSSNQQCRAQELIIEKTVLTIFEEREIPSTSSGLVQSSSIHEGMLVEHGALLMELDSETQQLGVKRLEQELNIARKQAQSDVEVNFATKSLDVARQELKRAQDSNREFPGLVPLSETDRLALLKERAEAELEKAQFEGEVARMQEVVKEIELNQSRIELDRRSILAPMSGRIEQVLKHEGEWVEISQPVAKLVRLDELKIETKISAQVATLDLVGKEVEFSPAADWLANKAYRGRVHFVESAINPVDSTVRVWLVIENPDLELRPGMAGSVTVDISPM